MGTHPIFESDFDCLTEEKKDTANRQVAEMQCEWCNRFFTSQHGVERHKTYCAWHPQRLKALKEQRKRRRNEKACYKARQEKVKSEDEGFRTVRTVSSLTTLSTYSITI